MIPFKTPQEFLAYLQGKFPALTDGLELVDLTKERKQVPGLTEAHRWQFRYKPEPGTIRREMTDVGLLMFGYQIYGSVGYGDLFTVRELQLLQASVGNE